MIKNIFWGIASLYTGNFERYIALENKYNNFNKFSFYVNENTFFIRSNFTNIEESIIYQDTQNVLDFQYKQAVFSPKIKIVHNKQSILFFSDTFGVLDLYWIQIDNAIIFSNSSFFLAKMLKKTPLGINGLFVHLILRGQANYSSYFEDIVQIPPQSILKLDSSGINISKREINFSPIVDLKDFLLRDIPLDIKSNSGVSFSGGIDSSIIASEFISKFKSVSCYSLINPNNVNLKTDLRFATLLAKQMNFTIKKVPFKIYEDIFYYDMPILDHDVYGQYSLAKYMLHDGKKIMVSGSGADELFGGYDRIFHYAYNLKIKHYNNPLDSIIQRYSYTDFNLLKSINIDVFTDVYNDIKSYYSHIVNSASNLVSQLHLWFIYHHLFWILKMHPQNIKCVFPYLREEFLSYSLQTDYEEIFPYIKYKQSDSSYNLQVKKVLKEQYRNVLPIEILNRSKLPFSVQETEIDYWYQLQYQKNKPDYLIPYDLFNEIMIGKYGNQTKQLFLSYILWRQRVL